MTNGPLVIVVGIWDIKIDSLEITKNVHVPKLSTTLISIRKLIEDLNFWVINHSYFCDGYDKVMN